MRSDTGENDDILISAQSTPVSKRPNNEENEENTQSSHSSDVLAVDQSQSQLRPLDHNSHSCVAFQSPETTLCLTSTTVTEPQVAQCNYVVISNPSLNTNLSNTVIFDKWEDDSYKKKLLWQSLVPEGKFEVEQISVHHFAEGPKIDVPVFQFQVADPDQITVVEKCESSWEAMQTSAVALYDCDHIAFSAYVHDCSLHAVRNQPGNESLLRVCPYGKSTLTDQALLLLGATQLLIMGWRVEGSPASRVLQNQLDCRLEYWPVKLEMHILKSIDEQMQNSETDKETLQLALYIMLLVIEKDLWRLMHWQLYPNEVCYRPSIFQHCAQELSCLDGDTQCHQRC
ncbi:hypothetical protein FOXYSP1_20932 [Fusarium oxysporum f. sp. phaseoli]